MTDLCVCNKGVGFAIVASLTATVALTTTAQGVGLDIPTSGANCATISVLPFSDTGDTTGLDCAGNAINDDFSATCPYSGSTSPDVFYNIIATPGLDAADGTVDGLARIDVITCGSVMDTQLYILDSSFAEVACVDDACTLANGDPYAAQILDVGLDIANPAGPEYFIALDGWAGAAGVYQITVDVTAGPCVVPPFGDPDANCGSDEGEGTVAPGGGQVCVDDDSLENDGIADDPVDSGVNDDCATTSSSIACNASVCGTSGTYTGNAACAIDDDCTGAVGDCDLSSGTCVPVFVFRDLDFYTLNVPTDGAIVTVRMIAEFTLNYFLFGPSPDCAALGDTQIFGLAGVGACVESSATVTGVDAGDYVILATSTFAATGRASCGANYELSVDCEVECPTDLNGDNSTGFADLTQLLNAWGACPTI